MSEASGSASFTEAVAELDEAGYNSMGFALEDEAILCLECGGTSSPDETRVGGLLGFEAEGGQEGLVFVLGCPKCSAKGMMFAGPEVAARDTAGIIDALTAKARG